MFPYCCRSANLVTGDAEEPPTLTLLWMHIRNHSILHFIFREIAEVKNKAGYNNETKIFVEGKGELLPLRLVNDRIGLK